MKKKLCIVFAVLLVAVLALAAVVPPMTQKKTMESASFGAYDHVIIVGIDGAGQFFRDGDMPNFQRIFKNGAVKYNVRTEVLTDSAPNWTSIISGVSYFKHRIHNGDSGENVRTSDTKYPTVFGVLRKTDKQSTLASFAYWANINIGIVENDIDVMQCTIPDDRKLCANLCNYLDQGNDPRILFTVFDLVDEAGHAHGSASEEYFTALHTADEYLGKVYDACERNGLLENGLFLVTADHGHTIKGGHGRFSKRESLTTIAAVGKTVIPGGTYDVVTRDRDIAAITLFALGEARPATMSARVPANLFVKTPGECRSFYKDALDGIISPVMWIVTQFWKG